MTDSSHMLCCLLAVLFQAALAALNPNSDYILQNYFAIQRSLTNHLFANYTRFTPAVYLSRGNHLQSRPLFVNVTLTYCRILSVEEAKQTIVMIAEFLTEWTDARLTWNPSDYYGFETIAVTKKDTVWTPDILGYDAVSSAEILAEDKQTINIAYNGSVNIYDTVVLEFICLLELTNFPFDTQDCDYQLSSFNYPQKEMTVTGYLGLNTSEFKSMGNGEWTVLNITAANSWYFDGPYRYKYSNPVFTFLLKRSTSYYLLQLITPSFIVTLVCMLGLFWDPVDADSYMDKLNLGFAAILAMMFVMQTGTEAMPKINETDKLSRYLLENLCIITIACVVIMILGRTRWKSQKKNSSDRKLKLIVKFALRNLHLLFLAIFSITTVLNFLFLIGYF